MCPYLCKDEKFLLKASLNLVTIPLATLHSHTEKVFQNFEFVQYFNNKLLFKN